MSNITHIVSGVTIFSTDQYKLFSMINGNRGLNQSKINKIIKEIEAGNDMLKYYPIQVRVVGDTMEILDGQHRFFISKKLKRPVYYILVTEDKSMPDIAKVNSNVEKWAAKDFMNCYLNQGLPDYIQLQKFIDQYGLTISLSVTLLECGSSVGKSGFGVPMENFRNGMFKAAEPEAAERLVTNAIAFRQFPGWSQPAFIRAIEKILAAALVPMDTIVQAFEANPEMLTMQSSYKQYIINLEQILNHRKSKRTTIV